ncbi:MAG: histidine ammonia-lyase [Propionibacteriaceae bacterium]|jgi:histidine ammonia-lyase|nr:histidine ammonia-lyase [Propionibacteriaceae bacterium]
MNVTICGPLSRADVIAIARGQATVSLSGQALADIEKGAAFVESLAADPAPHYGVSTGFGALATRQIPVERRADLQANLVRSHAASSGDEVDQEIIRAMMALRLATLATGRTGVRVGTAQAYAGLLNAGITPIVGEYGSLGCSGDLAPLAHVALALSGEGEVRDAAGTRTDAAAALAAAGLTPVRLREKEGLALINGTDGMLGMLIMALADLEALLDVADAAVALSIDGIAGNDAVFAPHLQTLRPHPGQATSAARVYAALQGSAIIADHKATGKSRVQDAYSLRCAAQVHGAARDLASFAGSIAQWELAAAIDNPVITDIGTLDSNGNFHGAPLGYALDALAIPVADVASMSERRTDRLLDKSRSGLPPFLADDPGVDSGLMIAQYTAAGIVSELKRLATPASVDSIPSSAMQEDHVSMGWAAGLKLRRALTGLRQVLAIELLTAARAVDLRAPLTPSPANAALIASLRQVAPGPGPDRFVAPEIAAVVEWIARQK